MAKDADVEIIVNGKDRDKSGDRKRGRPTKYEEDMPERVLNWLEEQVDTHEVIGEGLGARLITKTQLPTEVGVALMLRIDDNTLNQWKRKYPEFKAAIKEVKQTQHDRLLNGSIGGKYNAMIAKFILINNHGYKTENHETAKKPDSLQGVPNRMLPKGKQL